MPIISQFHSTSQKLVFKRSEQLIKTSKFKNV